MISFIDEHRGDYGVEPICRVLPIAPSTYHERVAQRRDPSRLSPRAQRDEAMKPEVRRVFDANFKVYGVRKVWRQMQREGFDIARCTVERLMRELGLRGVIRGKPVKTTVSDKAAPCPLDQVNRQFHAPAPNMLWVSDFTYVATWSGFVYVAFVIDVYARYIVGWRVSRTAHASFVLDALEQAIHDRRPVHRGGLIHHSDRGSQYVSIKYTERLAAAGIEPSVGSVGDSYDNALAETINNMTDTLAIFAEQVTTVAREVGVDGRLGGQANVPGAAGIWKALQIVYSDTKLADTWVSRPNDFFGGQAPLRRMAAGDVTDLAAVRAYIDAARAPWS